jgi:ribosomal protein L32
MTPNVTRECEAALSLKVCQDCGTAYLPAAVCPQCGGGVYRFSWEEEEMAKATVTGGGSNFAEGVPQEPEAVVAADEKPARPKPATRAKAAAAADDADTTE